MNSRRNYSKLKILRRRIDTERRRTNNEKRTKSHVYRNLGGIRHQRLPVTHKSDGRMDQGAHTPPLMHTALRCKSGQFAWIGIRMIDTHSPRYTPHRQCEHVDKTTMSNKTWIGSDLMKEAFPEKTTRACRSCLIMPTIGQYTRRRLIKTTRRK